MTRIACALGISRPHLFATRNADPKKRALRDRERDDEVVAPIRKTVDERPTGGYRRGPAHLNRQRGESVLNHKRVSRVRRKAGLLLLNHVTKPVRQGSDVEQTWSTDRR